MSVQRFVIIALLTGCTAGADRSDVGGSGDTALAESGFERECVDRIDIHPVCDCALTLSWSLNDTVERVGLVALSSSAVDARSTFCTEGLTEALLATAIYTEVAPGTNEVIIAALGGPTIVFLESSGQIVDPTIADPSSSGTMDQLSFYW